MNTKDVGDISVAMVLAALLRMGKVVLQPFGDNRRYDLVVDENGVFCRIQCKTGIIKKGVVRFPTCSSYAHRGRRQRDYKGEADLFAVYCHSNEKIYFVPVMSAGNRGCWLRLDAPKGGQTKGIRYAKDYEKFPG